MSETNIEISLNPCVFTSMNYTPGKADEACAEIEDSNKRKICLSELLYYRGESERALELCHSLESIDNDESVAGVYLVEAVTSLSTGNTEEITDIVTILNNPDIKRDVSPKYRKSLDLFTLYFNILIHNCKKIEFPETSIDAFAVPDEIKAMAVYVYSHYLITAGDYGRAIGLAEGVLIHSNNVSPVERIYLALVISIGYVCRGEWKKAGYFFNHAFCTALPDKLFMPFAENRAMLSGLLEKCLKKDFPAEYRIINDLAAVYHKNWITVHNTLTGDCLSDKLTSTEFNIAMLTSRGLSNNEIAEFFEISVNSVRAHLRNIFEKLGISNRKELSKYVIK